MSKSDDFGQRFKRAVESNFDQSAGLYDDFEGRHHLFAGIARRLCDAAAPFSPRRILDVGCGTGISTVAILDAVPEAREITGIDISDVMLQKARARLGGDSRARFVRGDAERLTDHFPGPFDAIFYTASIFLIPDFRQSIAQACRLLSGGGFLLISFYDGFFDVEGRDAFARVFPERSYRYGTVQFDDLHACLAATPELAVRVIDYRFEVTRGLVLEFLTIPAQSAGLFPKIPYLERIGPIGDLVSNLFAHVDPLFMGWKFVICRKR